MNRSEQNLNCGQLQPLLVAYTENSLSAREILEVERHLALCRPCTRQIEELRLTVSLLRNVERRDTAPDFMAKLHAQLDTVEPERVTLKTRLSGFGDWIKTGLSVNPARTSAFGVGLATAVICMGVFVNRPSGVPVSNPGVVVITPTQTIAPQNLHQNVALTSNDLFDDPAAANLEAHSALEETSGTTAENPSL